MQYDVTRGKNMMKRAICIIIAALICSGALFAWIGDVSLTNVGFNGTIENVGEGADGKHSDVKISVTKEVAQGSVYTIGKAGSGGECWINNLSISGSKAFTVNLVNCTIYGEVKITGGTVTFSGCTFEDTDGEKPAFDCTGMTGGSVTVTGGSVSHPTQFTMDFHGSRVTQVVINGLGGTSESSAITKLDMSGNTALSAFRLTSSVYISTLDLSGCTNSGLHTSDRIEEQWNNWKIVGRTTQSGSAFTKKGLIMSNTGLSGETTVNNPDIRSLDVSGNSISKLTVTGGGTSNSTLTHVFAADSGITSAKINMSPGTGAYLDLSGNSLGHTGGNAEKIVVSGPTKVANGITGYFEHNYPGGTDTGTLHADYEFEQTTNNTAEPITRLSDNEDDDDYNFWHCPGCGMNSNGGFSAWDGHKYHKHNDCGYDDREASQSYDVYVTFYVMATRNSYLSINDKAITTGFSVTGFRRQAKENPPSESGLYSTAGALPSGSQLKVNFSSEWNGLESMSINIRNNNIHYDGGYAEAKISGEYQMKYAVTSCAGEKSTDYVARFKWGGKHPESTSRWDTLDAGLKRDSSYIRQFSIQDPGFDEKFTKSQAGFGTSATFNNYHKQTVTGNTETTYGAVMYIYPFGEENQSVLTNN